LDGKVGNISFGFGRGSSRKYGCLRHSAAVGREAGFSASKEEMSWRPALERMENFERGSRGGVVPLGGAECVGGRRSDLAFGRERNPGQIWGVGGPVRAKI